VTTFETSARVKRPIEDVFGFVSDPLLFPRWNSAVQSVQGTSGDVNRAGGSLRLVSIQAGTRVMDAHRRVVLPERSVQRSTSVQRPQDHRKQAQREGSCCRARSAPIVSHG
jgi:uncharacterized protein YndB with AHSA1/START domain